MKSTYLNLYTIAFLNLSSATAVISTSLQTDEQNVRNSRIHQNNNVNSLRRRTQNLPTKSPKKTKSPKSPKVTKSPKSKKGETMAPSISQIDTSTSIDTMSSTHTQAPTINEYPDCHVPNRNWIGDGWCHDAPYNTPECGYDGGDCPIPRMMNLNCNMPITTHFHDGICDEQYNNEACGFDGGDCVPDCFGAGNGVCDGEFNTEECAYDGGDCVYFNTNFPNCTALHPRFVGDGHCDPEPYNTTACGYDGGDCIMSGNTTSGNATSGNATGNVTDYTTDLMATGDFMTRSFFEIMLNYFYPQAEDEILEWQK